MKKGVLLLLLTLIAAAGIAAYVEYERSRTNRRVVHSYTSICRGMGKEQVEAVLGMRQIPLGPADAQYAALADKEGLTVYKYEPSNPLPSDPSKLLVWYDDNNELVYKEMVPGRPGFRFGR